MPSERTFAQRLRSREPAIGYWVASDNPVVTERIALVGYDYVCLDLQHGLIDHGGCVRGLIAVTAGGCAGVVRVPVNEPSWIGRALDAGAEAVIVPLVNSAAEAAAAARACRYPPNGARSFGPTRSGLRTGPDPRVADESVACVVMIETREGLADVAAICATPGIDGVYIGPSDLGIALGHGTPAQGQALPEFGEALATVRAAAEEAGIAVGMHCVDGATAARALRSGFTFVSISNDLNHIQLFARQELSVAQGARP
jgi:4-hydroxy-2-oxoheptanedioate aldolase